MKRGWICCILQQLFNSSDVAVAGRFAESGALAAVGSNSVLVSLFVNLFGAAILRSIGDTKRPPFFGFKYLGYFIVSAFVESYDFSGKTIVPFCTSGGSGIGSSAVNLKQLTSGAAWLEGQETAGCHGGLRDLSQNFRLFLPCPGCL